jgi:protease-4
MDTPAPASNPNSQQPLLIANPAAGPLRIILEQPSRGLARFGRWLMGAVLGISLLLNISLLSNEQMLDSEHDVKEQYHSLERTAHDKVGIITVEGTIMHSDGFIKHQIDHVRKDKNVKAIVLRVDSPGGTVTGSDYLYHHLQEMIRQREIPIVVSMGGMAASGGYYVAMAAGDKPVIFAEPSTWTGSVGVIIPHYDVSGLLSRWDVVDDSISSDPMKQMGSLTRKWSKEEREKEQAILKGLVDDSFARFKDIVLKSRGPLRNNPEWQESVFTGRVFAADQAKANGLVDELGYLEDAIDKAISLAGLKKEHVEVVKYVKQSSLLDQLLLGAQGESRSQRELAALLELTAPRAYYLSSWLPALSMSSTKP